MGETIRLGTRRSPLALAQTNLVLSKLITRFNNIKFEVVKITTEGDEGSKTHARHLRRKDLFTKNLEERLLAGDIDIAVHSLKDLPSKISEGLEIASIPLRDEPRDAFVSATGNGLKEIREGAIVGTSSLRRKAQILAIRPDIKVVEIRGNVDTRVRKMYEGGLDGIVLAAAGLNRLGMGKMITELLPLDVMLPAAGQGAIALEVRSDDKLARSIATTIDDPQARIATEAERAFADRLGGGCNIPVAAYGEVRDGRLELRGLVSSMDGQRIIRDKVVGDPVRPRELGYELAERMISKGATSIAGVYHGD